MGAVGECPETVSPKGIVRRYFEFFQSYRGPFSEELFQMFWHLYFFMQRFFDTLLEDIPRYRHIFSKLLGQFSQDSSQAYGDPIVENALQKRLKEPFRQVVDLEEKYVSGKFKKPSVIRPTSE